MFLRVQDELDAISICNILSIFDRLSASGYLISFRTYFNDSYLINLLCIYISSTYQSIFNLSSFYHHSIIYLLIPQEKNTNIEQIALPLLLNHMLSAISYHAENIQLKNTFGVISTCSSK